MKEKYCKKCKKWIPIENFHKEAKAPDGLKSICKDCRNIRLRSKYIKKNEGKICSKCQKFLPFYKFSKRNKSLTHSMYQSYCVDCTLKYQDDYREQHKKEINELKEKFKISRIKRYLKIVAEWGYYPYKYGKVTEEEIKLEKGIK